MKILMISSIFPYPANSGGLIRIKSLLEGISKYHQVTFLAPIKANSSHEDVSADMSRVDFELVFDEKKNIFTQLRAVLSHLPYHVAWFRSKAAEKKVSELIKEVKFDLIYVHFLRTMEYLPSRVDVPVVLDQQNMDRDVWSLRAEQGTSWLDKLISKLNLYKMISYENQKLDLIDAFVSVSELDKTRTVSYAKNKVKHFWVAPNGVDIDYFSPPSNQNEIKKEQLTIGYLGAMNYEANVSAVLNLYENILPLIREQYPNIQVLIIGREPDRSILKIASQDESFSVTGTVDDIRPFINQVDICVAPIMFGGGTKLKVLTMMAMGIPVVGSEHALQGINVVDGIHAMVCRTPEEYVIKISELINNDNLRDKIVENALKLVRSQFSWDVITSRLASDLEILILQ